MGPVFTLLNVSPALPHLSQISKVIVYSVGMVHSMQVKSVTMVIMKMEMGAILSAILRAKVLLVIPTLFCVLLPIRLELKI